MKLIEYSDMPKVCMGSDPAIVIFSLEECQPCFVAIKIMAQMLEAGEITANVFVVKLSQEASGSQRQDAAEQYGIRFFPTLAVIEANQVKARKEGMPLQEKAAEQAVRLWLIRNRMLESAVGA